MCKWSYKIRCIFCLSFFIGDTLTSIDITNAVKWGKIRGHIFNRPISDEPTISLGIKSEYVPRAVVQLVNIFNCLAYDSDWMDKDELKVT